MGDRRPRKVPPDNPPSSLGDPQDGDEDQHRDESDGDRTLSDENESHGDTDNQPASDAPIRSDGLRCDVDGCPSTKTFPDQKRLDMHKLKVHHIRPPQSPSTRQTHKQPTSQSIPEGLREDPSIEFYKERAARAEAENKALKADVTRLNLLKEKQKVMEYDDSLPKRSSGLRELAEVDILDEWTEKKKGRAEEDRN